MPIIKLDRYAIIEIKKLIEEDQMTNTQISEQFGVSRRHINHIKLNKRWNPCYLCEEVALKEKQKQVQINVHMQEGQSNSSSTPSYRITI
jgi:predicted XRE-type DNA-binding protein